LHIKYTLTAADVDASHDLHSRSSSKLRFRRINVLWLDPVAWVALLALAVAALMRARDVVQFATAGALAGASVLRLWYRFRRSNLLQKQFARTHTGKEAQFDFDLHQVRCTSDNSVSEMSWSTFSGASSDSRLFLLYFAPANFLIFPRRAMTPAEQSELNALFTEHLPAGTYKKY
jgi:hypothetical protein